VSRPEAFTFVAGGTVQAGGGVYLPRRADDELLKHCRAGDFTYVLTSRQMGKSSLMIHTAERLAADGVLPVIIDLTEFGAQTTAEQWYKGFLLAVQDQLGLQTSAAEWWDAQQHHALAHRFTRYLREVALAQRPERIVIFVDEIDTTLGVTFTDDFFAAIRFLYQNRAADPDLHRLSFVLIGVATPGDLIKDTTRTPFNIGYRIDLTDFTLDEALALTRHLGIPQPAGPDLMAWILRWTGGHPYLTLRTVRSLAEYPPPAWTMPAIDERVSGLFLRTGADSDSNLQFVRDMLTKKAFNREAVLRTYADVRRGETVPDKELDQVVSWLKLSGVVCACDGALAVRNAIYDHVFDVKWALDHLKLNVNWRRRLVRLAAILLALTALITIPLAVYAWRQKTEAEHQRDDAHRLREIAEQNQATAEKALQGLEKYNPEYAAQIAKEVANARDEAQREASDLSSRLRTITAERDQAQRELTVLRRAMRNAGTASAAPAPSPAPGPPVRTADERAIDALLQQYQAAYRAKDLKALQQLQRLSPVEARAIKAEFDEALDYRIRIDNVDIKVAPDGRRAVVNARLTRVVTARGRGKMLDETLVRGFTLEKDRGNWVIVTVR
jgi:hypothetical protein